MILPQPPLESKEHASGRYPLATNKAATHFHNLREALTVDPAGHTVDVELAELVSVAARVDHPLTLGLRPRGDHDQLVAISILLLQYDLALRLRRHGTSSVIVFLDRLDTPNPFKGIVTETRKAVPA